MKALREARVIRWKAPVSPSRKVLLLGIALGLAGCQTDLFSGLTEGEANQMLAILVAQGIHTEKTNAGKDGFTLRVDERDMLRAISALKDNGYPRNTRESLGKVFQKTGLMSSPFEERVRYIYALGEEVGQTIGSIDGVITARVHIVLPEAPQLGQAVKPSSAAVFIKHQPGVDLDYLVPQIRRLVSSSIEGLDYASVTIVLAEARSMRTVPAKDSASVVEVIPGLAVRDSDQQRFWLLLGCGAFIIILLSLTNVATFLRFRLRRAKPLTDAVPAMIEP